MMGRSTVKTTTELPNLTNALTIELQSEVQQGTSMSIAQVMAHVPRAVEIATGQLIALTLRQRTRGRHFFQRWSNRPHPEQEHLDTAILCTALLAAGFTDIGSGHDTSGHLWAWGRRQAP